VARSRRQWGSVRSLAAGKRCLPPVLAPRVLPRRASTTVASIEAAADALGAHPKLMGA
jgi:hypothetical protein